MENDTLEHLEHAEHAEHAAHSGNRFNTIVSATIAVLAVVAAGVGSLETLETAGAISAKNSAVLYQAKASDQWAFFQAKSMKKNMYELAAVATPAKREEYEEKAKRYADESQEISKEAKHLEQESEETFHEGDHHEHRHHILTFGVTLLHVSIAIATISIISKGARWPWYAALALASTGLVISATAYI
jgi:Domain of unknown function (DUF4337)